MIFIDFGYLVLDEFNGWGRLDLVMVVDGYGVFINDVIVDMDVFKGCFNVEDWWRNDIFGSGMLMKKGIGIFVMIGKNSYIGGMLLQVGMLVVEFVIVFGLGDLYVENGKVIV